MITKKEKYSEISYGTLEGARLDIGLLVRVISCQWIFMMTFSRNPKLSRIGPHISFGGVTYSGRGLGWESASSQKSKNFKKSMSHPYRQGINIDNTSNPVKINVFKYDSIWRNLELSVENKSWVSKD